MKKHGLWMSALSLFVAGGLAGGAFGQTIAAPCTEKATGLVFPASIGSLVFSGTHEYEDANDGVDFRYSADGIAATIYIYNAGLERVPEGKDDPVHGQVMTQIKEDIKGMARQGIYQDLVLGPDEIIGLAGEGRGLKARHFLATYSFDGSSWHSHSYLVGYRDRFIKLRYSFRDEFRAEGEKQLAALLGWLNGAMGGPSR